MQTLTLDFQIQGCVYQAPGHAQMLPYPATPLREARTRRYVIVETAHTRRWSTVWTCRQTPVGWTDWVCHWTHSFERFVRSLRRLERLGA